MKSFSIKEALSFGWATFTARSGFFGGVVLLYAILIIAPSFAIGKMENVVLFTILNIAFQLFQYFLVIGLFRIFLGATDGIQMSISDLFSGGPFFVAYILATILYTLACAIGLVLLIIPGIIAMIMFAYYGYFIIDKNLGAIDALKASAALTKDIRWKLFGFGIVTTLLNVLGLLPVGLGLLITVPVSILAMSYGYRQLLSQTATLSSYQ